MLLIAIIALVLLGTAVALFARVAVMPRMKVAERLRQIDEYGFAPAAAAAIPAPDASLPPATGRLEPLANRLGELAMSRLGSNPEALRKDLRAAGLYRITPRVLIGYQVIAAIALPFQIGRASCRERV